MLTRQHQPHSLSRPCLAHSTPARWVGCRAKGRKGEQKNEGVYFEYREVEPKPARPERKAQPGEFSWVNRARGSVQQYKQVHKQQRRSTSSSSNTDQQQQEEQQEEQQQGGVSEPDTAAAAAVGEQAAESTSSATAAAVDDAPASSAPASSSSSSKEDALQQRKQQLLQRMKGPAAAAGAASASAPASAPASSTAAEAAAPPAAAAAAAAAQAASESQAIDEAAAAVAAAPQLKEFELDDDTDEMLQELISMAEALAQNPERTGLSSLLHNDPMEDPLAGLGGPDGDQQGLGAWGSDLGLSAEGASSSNGSSNGASSSSSVLDVGGEADRALSAFGAELAAAKAAMKRLNIDTSAAAAAAGDDDGSGSSDSPQQQQQQQGEQGQEEPIIRAADLLAWEAEQAREVTARLTKCNRTVTSMESALLAVQQDELREQEAEEGDEMVDDLDDILFDDDDAEDESSGDDASFDWLDNDPQLLRLLHANEAQFAELLKDMDPDADDGGSSGSSSGSRRRRLQQRGEDEEPQNEFGGLGVQDWLAVAEAAGSSGSSGGGGSGSSGSSDGLAGVMEAIDADLELDEAGRVQAKVRIAGVFNQDQGAAAAAAAAAAARQRSSSGSSGAAAAGKAGSSEVPELLPRPVQPKQPSQ